MTEQNAPARSRILAIAPYEGMNTAMQHAIEAYPEADFDIYTADLEAALDILNELNLQLYDCIISRGGTAELLRKKTALPVVEIPISIYDILRTIKLAENYSTATPLSASEALRNRHTRWRLCSGCNRIFSRFPPQKKRLPYWRNCGKTAITWWYAI